MNASYIPYELLTPEQRAEIEAWLTIHGIDPTLVPTDPDIKFHTGLGQTHTFSVSIFRVNEEGRKYLLPGSEDPAMQVVQHRVRTPLPWPRHPAKVLDDSEISTFGRPS